MLVTRPPIRLGLDTRPRLFSQKNEETLVCRLELLKGYLSKTRRSSFESAGQKFLHPLIVVAVAEDICLLRRTLLTWSDLDRPVCIAARCCFFQQASDAISSEDEWTARNPEQGVNLIRRHFTIRVRKLKRPICQLVTSATPVSEAPAKRLASARSSGELPGVNLPVAAERAAPPVNLEAELLMGDPNEYFDELARKRWRRKGDSTDPEPPTVVYRKLAQGCIILGGLPTAADRRLLQQHDVKLIVIAVSRIIAQLVEELSPQQPFS